MTEDQIEIEAAAYHAANSMVRQTGGLQTALIEAEKRCQIYQRAKEILENGRKTAD